MRTLILSAFLFLMGTNFLYSQDLYMPRNIVKAVNNGTRTTDGSPGKNYWQNKGKYNISETVSPETKIVSGTETIVYSNNSPDTLRSIAIRFVNNFHKAMAPRGGYTSENVITTGLDIQSFSVDGEAYNINSKNWGTVESVRLKKHLLPHSSDHYKYCMELSFIKTKWPRRADRQHTFYVHTVIRVFLCMMITMVGIWFLTQAGRNFIMILTIMSYQ